MPHGETWWENHVGDTIREKFILTILILNRHEWYQNHHRNCLFIFIFPNIVILDHLHFVSTPMRLLHTTYRNIPTSWTARIQPRIFYLSRLHPSRGNETDRRSYRTITSTHPWTENHGPPILIKTDTKKESPSILKDDSTIHHHGHHPTRPYHRVFRPFHFASHIPYHCSHPRPPPKASS